MSLTLHKTASYQPSDIKVALLVGGTSGEREVSFMSGKESEAALRSVGFQVQRFDTAEESFLSELQKFNCDVAFISLHGKGGEDGTIQGVLEYLHIPYTGSGVLASALAMDKTRTKTFYSAAGLPTPHSMNLVKNEPYDISELLGVVGEKSVVKPATEGSALGVTIVHNPDELEPAIKQAFTVDDVVLVERYVEGVEITVGVLGNDNPVALPLVEIVPHAEFYDFKAKYQTGGADHIVPARLSETATQAAQRIAVAAHKALGCRGMSRTDMIVDQFDTCWVLETNTIPGMTQTSLFPDAARHAGVSFEELCAHLVELALEGKSETV